MTRRVFARLVITLVCLLAELVSCTCFVADLKDLKSRRRSLEVSEAVPESAYSSISLVQDLTLAAALGIGTEPLVTFLVNRTELIDLKPDKVNPLDTITLGAAESIEFAAQFFAVLRVLQFVFAKHGNAFPQEMTEITFDPYLISTTIFGAVTLSNVKRIILLQSVTGRRLGRVELYNRLTDFCLFVVTTIFVLDEAHIDLGMSLQSVFAASGLGALFFSLASKDLAEQIVGGYVLAAWDAFNVGDTIRLGDGTEGTVVKIGLVETEIRGYDNVVICIPNSQLYNQRVSNLSRVSITQFSQTLRFKYSDLNKLEKVLNDIKREIQTSCPTLILDGSKPFDAVLAKYEPDHVQASINCHFTLKPGVCDAVTNREQVLLAIARAVELNEIEFAIPSIYYKTSD